MQYLTDISWLAGLNSVELIEWFLMTNEPRWKPCKQLYKIEWFHYVLKSGCAVEKIQERSKNKTTPLVLMYLFIVVVIMKYDVYNPNTS